MPTPKKQTKPIQPPETPMYLTWSNDQEKAIALARAGSALARAEPIVRSHGSDIFLNIAPNNVSVRDGFGRRDYDEFRPEDRIPSKPKEVIRACMDAYERVGIVRNVIDLMGDFATQGIDLNHPNERIEKWYKEWFRKVSAKERSERFLNLLYRGGNVVVKRQTAKLTARDEERMRRAQAQPDLELPPEPSLLKREVPWRYTFYNPLALEVLSDELSMFLANDGFQFAIRVPKTLARKVKNPKDEYEKRLVSLLPKDVVAAVRAGSELLPLDPVKTRAFYYKRDDWATWASPMVSAILGDIQVLQKMKLADLAALDGAISCIRVWKLGDVKEGIVPTEAAVSRLSAMLTNNVGGGVMDLVWDAAIDLIETSTDVHQFLGSTKYEPVLTSIYAGLGIPPTLTGAATQGGFTNNFISLKTLTERLQYGRDVLTQFWEEEIRLVQKAMGFRFPAKLVFDRMTLSDEAAEKALLIQLADRDILSWESVVERFGETPEIEHVRLRRESRKREEGQMPPKASPYHKADKEHELLTVFAGQGTVTPGQAGVELDERAEGEKTLLEQQSEQANKTAKLAAETQQQQMDHDFRTQKLQLKHGAHPNQVQQQEAPKGQPGQGRPKNAKDGTQRKQKVVKPRTSAQFFSTMAWAENAQAKIGQVAAPLYLKALGKGPKATVKNLSADEEASFERFKFFVLFQMNPGQEVDEAAVSKAVAAKLEIPAPVDELMRDTLIKHVEKFGGQPTMDVMRRYRAGAYAMWHLEGEDE